MRPRCCAVRFFYTDTFSIFSPIQQQPQVKFPRIAVKSQAGARFVREREIVVDEKVTLRTEEVPHPVTGVPHLRTVEVVEKVIETEVSFSSRARARELYIISSFFVASLLLPPPRRRLTFLCTYRTNCFFFSFSLVSHIFTGRGWRDGGDHINCTILFYARTCTAHTAASAANQPPTHPPVAPFSLCIIAASAACIYKFSAYYII